MTPPLHPDQLEVGHNVGPWRIVGSLGAGGFGRVFKVERGGHIYALKIALRPAGPQAPEEEDVNGRLSREVAALLACAPHLNLPRVHAVDRWPSPPDGYFFHVTDYVDGETFHEWRWRVKPTAAHLLTVYTEVVRVVADLHRRGVLHRDLKADNLLIRRADERPMLIDLGTARIPGASTLTVGVAPASPHLLPPECVAFLREGSWKAGANFDAGIPGDLYALGALLYESLTDGYAFDPRLPYDRLLPAIETVVPRAPQAVNPKVPPGLGDIAMRLLAKRPEDRYSGTETLLQALWDVAKDKRQPMWKLSLDVPEAREAPLVDRGVVSLSQFRGGRRPSPEAESPEPTGSPPPAAAPVPGDESPGTSSLSQARRRRVAGVLGLGGLLLGLMAFGLFRPAPRAERPVVMPVPEKGKSSVPPTPSLPDAAVLAVASAPDAGAAPQVASSMPPPAVTQSPPVKPLRADGGVMRKLAGVTAAACMGAACATGGTGVIREAEGRSIPCPAGAAEAMKTLGIKKPDGFRNAVAGHSDFEDGHHWVSEGWKWFIVRKGKTSVAPEGGRIKGRVVFLKGVTRFLFTELELANGASYPVCMENLDAKTGEFGWAPESGTPPETPTHRDVGNILRHVIPVKAFADVTEE
ncbi:serine/threonine protein kinase [Corallococcus sicarius]|uniref:non-specific serine/threonine protein kinase n=1 Tax=Corallococcus sicarius TaxID=2316726 RepID=A0A3A8N3N9_9BACT|nr:serine/threonine-protein kinase [Corallococcus sicarius]RKH39017.1 serine/threonine protein kinase [Corallococcus sicarius]